MSSTEQQQQHPFLTSTHTIDEYKELQHKREFAALEHAQWLMETVAQTTHGYIFKRRRGHSYWLEEVKADAIIKRILNFNITVAHETTTTVGNTSTTKRTLKQYKAYVFITSEDHPALATYDFLEMFTRDPHRLFSLLKSLHLCLSSTFQTLTTPVGSLSCLPFFLEQDP